jgi:hypothetical protein
VEKRARVTAGNLKHFTFAHRPGSYDATSRTSEADAYILSDACLRLRLRDFEGAHIGLSGKKDVIAPSSSPDFDTEQG